MSTDLDYLMAELQWQQTATRTVEDTREPNRQIREAGTEEGNFAAATGTGIQRPAFDILMARLDEASRRWAALEA